MAGELASEVAKGKLTLAGAEQRLKDAAEALERFADQVYQAREAGGAG